MGHRGFLFCAALLTGFLCSEASAGSLRLKGVEIPGTAVADGHTLKLQGAGVRKKLLFSVYVGALYLSRPTSEAGKAIGADEPKRIALHYLRDVSSADLREAFEEGFFRNSQEKLDRLRPRIDRLLSLHGSEVEGGQVLTYTYLPSAGTRVAVDGAEKGVIEGRDFMEALFAVWLGEVPPSHDLKRGMLGQR